MIRSSMRRYHTYPPHRAPTGALCEGSSMRTCRYAQSSDRSSMRRELYAALHSTHSHQQKVLFQTQYLMWCHLCTKRTTRDQERCFGGHPTKPEPSQILLNLQQLVVVWSKEKNLSISMSCPDSIAKQFAFKEFMRRCIKRLFKIHYECVNLSSIVQDFSPIIYYRSQLSFTTMSFPECMLSIWQEFIFIKMSHDIWTYYMFE